MTQIFRPLWAALIFAAIVLIAGSAVAETAARLYEPGPGALQVWNSEGSDNLPLGLIIWLAALQIVLVSSVLFVRHHVAARWLLAGYVSRYVVGAALINFELATMLAGLSALMHVVFWMPGFVLLCIRRPIMQDRSVFAIWASLATVMIFISFIFDFRDAATYLGHVLEIGRIP